MTIPNQFSRNFYRKKIVHLLSSFHLLVFSLLSSTNYLNKFATVLDLGLHFRLSITTAVVFVVRGQYIHIK